MAPATATVAAIREAFTAEALRFDEVSLTVRDTPGCGRRAAFTTGPRAHTGDGRARAGRTRASPLPTGSPETGSPETGGPKARRPEDLADPEVAEWRSPRVRRRERVR
ncbi:hypothetical protein GCM10010293_12850 [Streptomyces griseoflavus]|nr:hypothetical protein GCM10010293_12850 [Streptomyces griseoflavus]